MKQALKTAFRHVGIEVWRINPVVTTTYRRLTMMKHHGINTVIDVGANVGQYSYALRASGYEGDILSFEPLSEAYEALEKKAKGDPNWRVFHLAIGAENGESKINIARNSTSSSLLPMLEKHLQAAPQSEYLSSESVKIQTLDCAIEGVLPHDRRVLLKIDTQGFEAQVLQGTKLHLPQVCLIECELSLVPLYEGQCLFQGMINRLHDLGFEPVHFEPAFSDSATGYCLQVDGIFARPVSVRPLD